MTNERFSHLQKANLIEWDLKQVTSLGLQKFQISMIEKMLSNVGPFCDSIILYGSWAEGTSHSNSDLDLLFITRNERDKKTTITHLERMFTEFHISTFDCKVLMIDELRSQSKGLQHFAIWLMLSTGIILTGVDVRNMVKLAHERVRDLLNDLLDRINNSIAELASNYQYRGVCGQIAYIVRTLYYVEKHILKNGQHNERKQEYVTKVLGEQYREIEKIYHKDIVSKKSIGQLESVQKLQTRKGYHYSSIQYEELLDISLALEHTIIRYKEQLQTRFDLP